MKGKEFIKLIQDGGFEDFEIKFAFTDGHNIFPNIRTFESLEISDVGYSEKTLQLEGKEKE